MLIEHMAYASTVTHSEKQPPTIVWAPNFSSVTYKETTLNIEEVRKGMRKLYDDLTESLGKVIGKHSANINPTFSEDFTDTRQQHSFLNHGDVDKQYLSLLADLMNPESEFGLVDVRDGKLHWKKGNCVEFLALLENFMAGLMILCYMLPSQAPRSTEYIDYRLRNADNLRNVFYSDGLWFVNQRVKTSNLTESHEFIPSVVPKELEKLLLDYLILVRPIEAMLAQECFGDEVRSNYEEFLFVRNGERVTADYFSRMLETTTIKYMGVCIGVRAWRHLAIAIMREFVPEIYQVGVTEVGDASSAHSSNTAKSTYGVSWGMLGGETSRSMRAHRKFCTLWQELWGFGAGPVPIPLEHLQKPKDASGGFGVKEQTFGPAPRSLMEELSRVVEQSISATLVEHIPAVIHNEFKSVIEIVRTMVAKDVGVGGGEEELGSQMQVDENAGDRMEVEEREAAGQSVGEGGRGEAVPIEIDEEWEFMDEREDGGGRGSDEYEKRYGKILVPSSSAMDQGGSVLERPGGGGGEDGDGDSSIMWSPVPSQIPETPLPRRQLSSEGPSPPPSPSSPLLHRSPLPPPYPVSKDKGKGRQKPVPEKTRIDLDQEEDALECLQIAVGDRNAHWKSEEQRELVMTSWGKGQNVIGVIATGGGKSAAYEVPIHSLWEKGVITTVVFSPFVSLQADVERRVRAAGAEVQTWSKEGRLRQGFPQVMVASYENIASQEFKRSVRLQTDNMDNID